MTEWEKMKAVTILKYDESEPQLELREKEVPTPKENEVRIKIHLSPINPSDLMFIRGLYGFKKKHQSLQDLKPAELLMLWEVPSKL